MKADTALEELRYLLTQWRRWVRGWQAPLGYPSASPFVRIMRPSVAWDGTDQEAETDQWILRAVDAEIESLGSLKRAAVRLVYLREVMPAAFRSGRLSMEEAVRLCNEAEVEMIPGLRKRNVVLGGY
jgi:hypothetical protein